MCLKWLLSHYFSPLLTLLQMQLSVAPSSFPALQKRNQLFLYNWIIIRHNYTAFCESSARFWFSITFSYWCSSLCITPIHIVALNKLWAKKLSADWKKTEFQGDISAGLLAVSESCWAVMAGITWFTRNYLCRTMWRVLKKVRYLTRLSAHSPVVTWAGKSVAIFGSLI